MHDSLKGFIATLLLMGAVCMYIATHQMTTFTSFYALPIMSALIIACMPNSKWLMGSMAVYLLPVMFFVYGLISSEDLDAGGTMLLVALAYLVVSLAIGLITKFVFIKLGRVFWKKLNYE